VIFVTDTLGRHSGERGGTESPLLAPNGHADRIPRCPLSAGAKRKTYARVELFRF